MKPQIVNIINFIRGVEPRDSELDLFQTVVNQIHLIKRYKLPATFLIQYDAMIQDNYVKLLNSELDDNYEIGAWLEIVQPLVEKAGLKWRGRPGFSWDWHADVGFTVGYTPQEREKLIDVFMKDFKDTFGYYPASVGSWLIDAHSLAYLAGRYGIVASCNCKDQWGTDGYTVWGGYYNQAYYPSRKNVFTPAQHIQHQIPVPIFRMLGSDPIYQYDIGLHDSDELNPSDVQPVVTLEPVYKKGGGSPAWVQWYFRENFNGICLSFGYAQLGQENSFGWDAMAQGLTYQIELIAQKASKGELRVETLRDSGKWFKSRYDVTPASAIAALSDWQDLGHRSVWYCSRFYRVNLFWEQDRFWLRDIHLFDESYTERYLNDTCKGSSFVYDNLPIMDGNRWSKGNIRAGIRPVEILSDGSTALLTVQEPDVKEIDDDKLLVGLPLKNEGFLEVLCQPEALVLRGYGIIRGTNWGLEMIWGEETDIPIIDVSEKFIEYNHNGYVYRLYVSNGHFSKMRRSNVILLLPDDDVITLVFNIRG